MVCAPRVAWCDGGGVAGVEDVVGFALPVVRWVPGWYGCAFGLPDRHPRLLPGAIRCPSCLGAGRVPARWRGGAWWLENWIVDASKTRVLNLCFAVDFESNSIVRFDRFVIIFSVMICRLGIC